MVQFQQCRVFLIDMYFHRCLLIFGKILQLLDHTKSVV